MLFVAAGGGRLWRLRLSRRPPAVAEGSTSAASEARLGSPVLFGLVQAFVAAGFYFSLGLVAERAQGWTGRLPGRGALLRR